MSVVIPDEVLEASRMTENELKVEVAVMLFEKGKLSLGQASRLAALHHLAFQHLLARALHGWVAYARRSLPRNPPVPPLRKGGKGNGSLRLNSPPLRRGDTGG